jgi:lipopolysaccharide export system permease protein
MRILRNYILKEMISPFVFSLLGLTGVMLLGNLVRLVQLVVNKGVSILLVLKLFIYLIPFLLSYTLPIACLITVLLTFGRLSSDNEILAIRASGIHMIKIISPLLYLGLVLSLVSVILNDRMVPYAHFASRQALTDIGSKNPGAALEAGTFINAFQGRILFIYHIDGNKMSNIRIYEPQGKDKPTRTIVAKKGEFVPLPEQKKVKLKLIDGTSDEPDLKKPENFFKLNFKTYFLTLDLQQQDKIDKKPKDMTILELMDEIGKFRTLSVETAPLLTEIHKKIALAFAPLIFVLFGLPLAIITHRRQKRVNFLLAFGVVAVYYLLSLGCEALGIQNFLPPEVAMWIPNIIFGGLGILFTYRLCVY